MGHMGYDLGDGYDVNGLPVTSELTGSAKTHEEGLDAIKEQRIAEADRKKTVTALRKENEAKIDEAIAEGKLALTRCQ